MTGSPRPRTLLLLALGAALAGSGAQCPSSQVAGVDPDYAASAEENYTLGMQALEEGDVLEAEKFFEQVVQQFPYTRAAVLARLRQADCDYEQENYRAAATGYQTFIDRYPSDAEVPYALFRRGLSFFALIPSDFFLMPASHTRDRQAARDALRELRSFVDRYPESEYAPEARERIGDCLAEMARGELSVAEFYLDREEAVAASLRARTVLREYGDSGLAPEALLLLGRIALDAGDAEAARGYFALLASRYPDSHERDRALRYLRFLAGTGEEP